MHNTKYQEVIRLLHERRKAITKKILFPKLTLKQIERVILKSLDAHKAEDIVSIDLKGKSDFADLMIVASGSSQRHLGSLSAYLIDDLKAVGFPNIPVEGQDGSEWVLVDAGNVIVHLFKPEARTYYNIEKMWSVSLAQAEAAY